MSGITIIRYARCEKIGKPNNLKSLGASKKPKQNSQHLLWSPIPKEGEP